MSLSSHDRQALLKRSHHLAAAIAVSSGALDDAAIAHVRSAFARQDLVKVRVQADSGAEADAAAAELSARVPCELVKRIGRVAILYRPLAGESGA